MIVKTKKVYYCEFCKKRSLRKDSMEKHEKYCTLNPDRICRLCGELDIKPLIEKCKSLPITENTVSEILDECDCCPNCTLAVLRCIDAFNENNIHIKFDYRKELQIWWDAKNEEGRDEYYGDY